jgi:hypothetical protein
MRQRLMSLFFFDIPMDRQNCVRRWFPIFWCLLSPKTSRCFRPRPAFHEPVRLSAAGLGAGRATSTLLTVRIADRQGNAVRRRHRRYFAAEGGQWHRLR